MFFLLSVDGIWLFAGRGKSEALIGWVPLFLIVASGYNIPSGHDSALAELTRVSSYGHAAETTFTSPETLLIGLPFVVPVFH